MTYEIALLGQGLGTELDRPRVQAYLYAGWWVANCVDITCQAVNIAEESGPTQKSRIQCPDCGASADVVWPDDHTFEVINKLMSFRPHRGSRNWAPPWHRQSILTGHPLGQSLDDLALENLDHGIRI